MKMSKKMEEKNAEHVRGHRFLSSSLTFLRDSKTMKKRVKIQGKPSDLQKMLMNPNADAADMRIFKTLKKLKEINFERKQLTRKFWEESKPV